MNRIVYFDFLASNRLERRSALQTSPSGSRQTTMSCRTCLSLTWLTCHRLTLGGSFSWSAEPDRRDRDAAGLKTRRTTGQTEVLTRTQAPT